jgi:hypothetical protein
VRCMVSNIFRTCNSCSSKDVRQFSGEFAIHFPASEGLNQAIVWVFPEVSVCLHCGAAEFSVPDRELEVLRTGTPAEGAVVLLEKGDKQNGARPRSQDEAAGSRRPGADFGT